MPGPARPIDVPRIRPGVHVIGAGLAGLATAVGLARRGAEVTVHEAAGQAGGRCRSFHDASKVYP